MIQKIVENAILAVIIEGVGLAESENYKFHHEPLTKSVSYLDFVIETLPMNTIQALIELFLRRKWYSSHSLLRIDNKVQLRVFYKH